MNTSSLRWAVTWLGHSITVRSATQLLELARPGDAVAQTDELGSASVGGQRTEEALPGAQNWVLTDLGRSDTESTGWSRLAGSSWILPRLAAVKDEVAEG